MKKLIINADGFGEIVSTSFYNYSMPFIRYKVGDIGKISHEKCSCGNNFPKLEKISGRIDDVIKLNNGKSILPLSVRISMKSIGLDNFQIVKINDNSFNVNLFSVSKKINSKALENKIIKVLEELFETKVNLYFYYDKKPILTKYNKN